MKKDSFSNTIKYFMGVICKYAKVYMVYGIVYIILKSIEPFINIFITRNIVNELATDKSTAYLITQVSIIVLSVLFISVAGNLLTSGMNNRIFQLDDLLSEKMGRKSMSMDFEHTENAEVLMQAEKATTGMSFYSGGINGIMTSIIQIVNKFIILLGTMYIIALVNPVIIISIIVITVLNYFVQYKVKEMDMNFWNNAVGINRTYSYFCDIAKDFTYGKDIRIHSAKNLIFSELDKFTEDFDHFSAGHFKTLSLIGSIEVFFITVQLAVIYIFLANGLMKHEISIANFTMYITATITLSTTLKELLEQVLDLKKKASFLGEYVKFISLEDRMDKSRSREINNATFEIVFRDVSFSYPNSTDMILNKVNFTLKKGDKLSIVGLNGAGKTTMIKLLIRLYEPVSGEILLNGINIKEYDYQQYLNMFSVVFQDFSLFAYSVQDNITCGEEADKERYELSVDKAGMTEIIQKLRHKEKTMIYKIFDDEGTELSGGQAQKLAIARAYYKDAPIIIMDEPTSALDPYAENEIYAKLNQLASNKTSIYISHRMSSCQYCDQIYVFDKGTISERGTHAELLQDANSLYHKLFTAQAVYYKQDNEQQG